MMTKDEWIKAAKLVLWDVSRMQGGSYHLSKEAQTLFSTIEQMEDEDRRATEASHCHDSVAGRFSNDAMCRGEV
jgi:hypothetical protein